MALFRKFFHRKPPEGLLEISERVYGMLFLLLSDGFRVCFLILALLWALEY
ncbi:hypothetical protein ISN45_At02g019000 [Arabidopsis thaliana x Arabidopsis arenosa]|jgi:hypothetical protein|uniref:Uncharacterized protein n=2 Tax=Arabidopsis TaxID=3701 RepID=A0A8T2G176_ARASU|nr:hypothetical protein ISN45_At02g019000 [Arabidopsis thaliana x Arabidopsis arenosa]KAG7641967.1 hypothetical protein ISN44_As02g019400 [Arabidopsis suecica]